EAYAGKTDIQISPQKLNDICRTVRGLSVREAMIQLKLSHKKKACVVRALVGSAASNAVNNLDMNAERLYIGQSTSH
ncbi:uL22 family ribosomal protein, partial [Klebsiella pneumoniae]|nr:uL22 family ribosomal protein [Klebsiella pneumoniae]